MGVHGERIAAMNLRRSPARRIPEPDLALGHAMPDTAAIRSVAAADVASPAA